MSQKQSQVCCVLLQAKNKPRFAVPYEPETNPGLLFPAMSWKQIQVCCPATSLKQSQVCCVLLRAKNKPRFTVSYAHQNKPRIAVSSKSQKQTGLLCPSMSQNNPRFAVSCYEPKTNKVCCVLLWAENTPRFAVSCYKRRFAVYSYKPKTNPGLLFPAMSLKQTQVWCPATSRK